MKKGRSLAGPPLDRSVPGTSSGLLAGRGQGGHQAAQVFSGGKGNGGQNGDVRALLKLMAEELGLNAVISDTVTGTTTLVLKDVPADQVIDIIFQLMLLRPQEFDVLVDVLHEACVWWAQAQVPFWVFLALDDDEDEAPPSRPH